MRDVRFNNQAHRRGEEVRNLGTEETRGGFSLSNDNRPIPHTPTTTDGPYSFEALLNAVYDACSAMIEDATEGHKREQDEATA
jgi:hypothetical protein